MMTFLPFLYDMILYQQFGLLSNIVFVKMVNFSDISLIYRILHEKLTYVDTCV